MWGTELEKSEFGKIYPLFYGRPDERNYTQGIKVVKSLARKGYVPAIYQLGLAYFDHLGVHRNYIEAFRMYLAAANEGYPSAECGVGNFYAMAHPKHQACEIDPNQALIWWLKASNHGNSSAQYNLANAYLQGTSVRKDPVEAYVWSSLAVHCSTIRFRPAEVIRDQASSIIDEDMRKKANQRIHLLQEQLPFIWSEHLIYWQQLEKERKLHEISK